MMDVSGELNAPTHDDEELRLLLSGGHKKRLLKKAPNAPKRFKTSYICFVMEKMDSVKEESSKDVKVGETSVEPRNIDKINSCQQRN
jgi:hypothetical protein